jgi:hypothetical protein
MSSIVRLQIPDTIYHRLQVQAIARSQPLEEVLVHALNIGSPPDRNDVPMGDRLRRHCSLSRG